MQDGCLTGEAPDSSISMILTASSVFMMATQDIS